jgi:transposase
LTQPDPPQPKSRVLLADDPLYRIRGVLRRGAEQLTNTGWARMLAGIDAGDQGGHVAASWVTAQELRAIYRCRDRDQAASRLYDWIVFCVNSGVPELHRFARTITTWRTEFLAYFVAGRSPTDP